MSTAAAARLRVLAKVPGVDLPLGELEAFLRERAAEGAIEDAAVEEELCLTFACARGDAKAIAYLDRTVLSRVPSMLRHMRLSDASLEDVQQELRLLLLVEREGAPPKIGEFGGRSPLYAWVRVTATRLALRSSRKKASRAEIDDDGALIAKDSGVDEELAHLKDDQRRAFRDALNAAVQSLPSEDVMRLRLHYIDGLSLDDLARLEGVHRATVARWLSRAREHVLERTRQALGGGRLSESECTSLLGIAQSRFEWSLRAFGTAASEEMASAPEAPRTGGRGST